MTEKKTIEFLNQQIEVQLLDHTPEGHGNAIAGVLPTEENEPFKIWFNGLVTDGTLVHECWHLFMTMMGTLDESPKYFLELNSEIYAYTFHTLFLQIKDTVTGMKSYKALYRKRGKK